MQPVLQQVNEFAHAEGARGQQLRKRRAPGPQPFQRVKAPSGSGALDATPVCIREMPAAFSQLLEAAFATLMKAMTSHKPRNGV